MGRAFNGTVPNLNWAVNRLNNNQSDILKSIAQIISNIGNIFNGGGTTASNETVEKAVQWLVNKASNNYITYSQSNRNLKNVNGSSYDCSSFIITGFYAAGLDVDASYTGDMRDGFTAKGFTWIPGSNFESSQCLRGDILLNESIHTQMYIGNNQDVNCGSTPARVITHSSDNFGRGWSGILRYVE